jgi:hypothetical protein
MVMLEPGYCMRDRGERPQSYWRRHRQGAEDFLPEDIIEYFEMVLFANMMTNERVF